MGDLLTSEAADAPEKYDGPGHLLHVVFDSTALFGSSTPNQRVAHRPRDAAIPSLAKPKLVAGIEQFILAFAYPVASALKTSASATASISSARAKDIPLPSPSHSTSTIAGSPSSNGVLLGAELGFTPRPQSLAEILNGKPAPYILKAGVLGEVFSFSAPAGGDVRTVGISDLLLFGGFDGSIEEHGGGKAWLGGVGAQEIVDGLCGKIEGTLEVRHSTTFENVWIGGLEDDPRPRRKEKQGSPRARRQSLSRTPSSSSIGAASSSSSSHSPEHAHRPLSKVLRKPAPTLAPSDSMTAAWDALQSQAKSKTTHPETVQHQNHSAIKEEDASADVELGGKDAEQGLVQVRARKASKERKDAGPRRRKSMSWNPDTGLLTPPGSSSEKDIKLEDSGQLKRYGSDSTHYDTSLSLSELTQSVSPPSTMGERTDSSQSEESQTSASVPTLPSSRENEESFDFASCYQYDRSQCPQARQESVEDGGIAVKAPRNVEALPRRDTSVGSVPPPSKGGDNDLGSLRGKATPANYHYAKVASTQRTDALSNGDGDSMTSHVLQSTTISSIKKKSSSSRLGKLLGRVLSIRGSPDSPAKLRRRRLSVLHTEL